MRWNIQARGEVLVVSMRSNPVDKSEWCIEHGLSALIHRARLVEVGDNDSCERFVDDAPVVA